MNFEGITTHRCWVYEDNINTDVIFAGKYTYTLTDPTDIARHALEDIDTTFADDVQDGDIIIAGRNWGCGSSREQAVTALKYAGVSIIIAESFSRIYFRNCINQGVLPVICVGLHNIVQRHDTIKINWDTRKIYTQVYSYDLPILSPSVSDILLAGGLVPMLQQQFREQENL